MSLLVYDLLVSTLTNLAFFAVVSSLAAIIWGIRTGLDNQPTG